MTRNGFVWSKRDTVLCNDPNQPFRIRGIVLPAFAVIPILEERVFHTAGLVLLRRNGASRAKGANGKLASRQRPPFVTIEYSQFPEGGRVD